MARRQTVGKSKTGSGRKRRTPGESRAAIRRLIADLTSSEGRVREAARQRLVDVGKPAVAPLTKALASGDVHTRWEAAKALGEIADPSATPALVHAMRDDEFGIRWLAADGLILIGPDGLEPLLRTLIEHSDSLLVRQGAHHVLRALSARGFRPIVRPVLAALDGAEPALEVPPAAEDALEELARAGKQRIARQGQRSAELVRVRIHARRTRG